MDLLLISIDSLRLDHAPQATASCVHTPRFAAGTAGFTFSERCFSVSSATRPVHTSLVTGLYPFEHGIVGQTDRRVRAGTPRLFRQFTDAGYRVGLFSEAPEIFTDIDLGAPITRLAPEPVDGSDQLDGWLRADKAQRCLFLHYWSAHTPYGASDGQAMGETARLLRDGQTDVVRGRYRQAVETVFEHKLATLIERLDLGNWVVVIFGDHGESWTADELYHGKSLRNAVLRVPLLVHVPYRRMAALDTLPVVSLLDLHPTLQTLLALPGEPYRGRGRDLCGSDVGHRHLWAEIRPGLDDDALLVDAEPATTRWCVFDEHCKLMGTDESWELLDTWSEASVPDAAKRAAPYLAARQALRAQSPWLAAPLAEAGDADDALLRRRLRDLGYLG